MRHKTMNEQMHFHLPAHFVRIVTSKGPRMASRNGDRRTPVLVSVHRPGKEPGPGQKAKPVAYEVGTLLTDAAGRKRLKIRATVEPRHATYAFRVFSQLVVELADRIDAALEKRHGPDSQYEIRVVGPDGSFVPSARSDPN